MDIVPELRRNKARDLVRLLFGKNIEFVKDRLKNDENSYFAIECLGYFPSSETVKILAELLKHKDSNIQLCAAGALKNQAPRHVVPVLVKAMLYEDILPARAGDVLLTMGPLALEFILEVYPLAIPKVKIHLLELLVQGNNPKCKNITYQALRSSNIELISRALDAVVTFQFVDLWPEVVSCLTQMSHWNIKAKALYALEILAVEETREDIKLLLADEDPWICECATKCLKILDEKGASAPAIVEQKAVNN
jgi:HEAT repeat protein